MAGKGLCWDVVGRMLEESWVPDFELDTATEQLSALGRIR